MALLNPFGQRFGKGHLGIYLVETPYAANGPMGVAPEAVVVYQFDTHALPEKIHAILSRIAPA